MKVFIIIACCIGVALSLVAIGMAVVCLTKEAIDYINNK